MKLSNSQSSCEKTNKTDKYLYLLIFSCLINSCAANKWVINNDSEIKVDTYSCDMFFWKLDTWNNSNEEKEIIDNWVNLFEKLTNIELFTEKSKNRIIKILFLPKSEVTKIFIEEYENRVKNDLETAKWIYEKWGVSKEDYLEYVLNVSSELQHARNYWETWWVNWYSWTWEEIYMSNNPGYSYNLWDFFDEKLYKGRILTHEIIHRFDIWHNGDPYNEKQNLMNDWWARDHNLNVELNSSQIIQIKEYYKQCSESIWY